MKINIGNTYINCHNYKFCKEKVLIFAHGFPGTNRLPKLIPHLNKKGVAWVEINYKGDKYTNDKFSFIGSIKDIKNGINFIREKFNPIYLNILGYSYGGFCTLNLIRTHREFFNKIILLNPVIDANFFKIHPIMPTLWNIAKNILNLREKNYYEKEIDELINRYNPIEFKKELPKRIYIIQSTNDMLCPFNQAKKFAKEIEAIFIPLRGKSHDLEGDELINILPL